MRIASIIDVSTVDVPGIPVTVLFTAGCNFDCPYCQNAQIIPLSSGSEMPVEAIVGKTHGSLSSGFCISGGEPTIHRDLPKLLKELKRARRGHINLNTQGSVPEVLEACLPHIDSVWFDIKAAPDRYQQVVRTPDNPWKAVHKSVEILLSSDVDFWPRTTYAADLMSPHDIREILRVLDAEGFQGEYVLQNYVRSLGTRRSEDSNLRAAKKEEVESLFSHLPSGITVRLEGF